MVTADLFYWTPDRLAPDSRRIRDKRQLARSDTPLPSEEGGGARGGGRGGNWRWKRGFGPACSACWCFVRQSRCTRGVRQQHKDGLKNPPGSSCPCPPAPR